MNKNQSSNKLLVVPHIHSKISIHFATLITQTSIVTWHRWKPKDNIGSNWTQVEENINNLIIIRNIGKNTIQVLDYMWKDLRNLIKRLR